MDRLLQESGDALALEDDSGLLIIRKTFTEEVLERAVGATGGIYLRLGEAAGTFVDTMVGNDGTEVGTLTRHVADSLLATDDGAISTNNVANYVNVPDTVELDGGVWSAGFIAAANSTAAQIVASKGTGSWNLGRRTDTGKMFVGKPGTTVIAESSGAVPTDGTKVFYGFTANGTGALARKVFVSGADVTVDVSAATAFVDSANALHIGHDQDPGNTAPWDGLIDEFFWLKGVVLTATDWSELNSARTVNPDRITHQTPYPQVLSH